LGRRGRGKSSLCNLLTQGPNWDDNNNGFGVRHGGFSGQTYPQWFSCVINGEPWEIKDTTGFDDTVSKDVIAWEIYDTISTVGIVDGILFVVPSARYDDWDETIYSLYLQFLLSDVPSSMIGIVVTSSSDDYLVGQNVNEFKILNTSDGQLHPFVKSYLDRSNEKVAFVNNPDPHSKVTLIDETPRRTVSLNNCTNLIGSLSGNYDCTGFFSTIKRTVKKGDYIFSVTSFRINW